MPLLDHFRSSFSEDWPWESIHAAWANAIAANLNGGLLPPDYYALPLIKRGLLACARGGRESAGCEISRQPGVTRSTVSCRGSGSGFGRATGIMKSEVVLLMEAKKWVR